MPKDRRLRHRDGEARRRKRRDDAAGAGVDAVPVGHRERATALSTHDRIVLRVPSVRRLPVECREVDRVPRRHAPGCFVSRQGLDLDMELASGPREGRAEADGVDLSQLRRQLRAPSHGLAPPRAREGRPRNEVVLHLRSEIDVGIVDALLGQVPGALRHDHDVEVGESRVLGLQPRDEAVGAGHVRELLLLAQPRCLQVAETGRVQEGDDLDLAVPHAEIVRAIHLERGLALATHHRVIDGLPRPCRALGAVESRNRNGCEGRLRRQDSGKNTKRKHLKRVSP
mmetsp:Transcript_80417/g.209451  ORF Transcript_80417/g.209451 Transcript_80417/m.209451 type:complete len:284 (-) Transcript_80417:46-897(-)